MTRLIFHALTASILTLGVAPGLRADEPDEPSKPENPPTIVDLTLKGSLSEGPRPLGLDGTPVGQSLRSLTERMTQAKEDEQVQGLVLRLRDLSIGMAKAHELRRAIEDFRASGKPVVAVLEMAGNADYMVAAAADEVVMPAQGWLMVKGLAAEVLFYKGLFDKLDIQADLLQVGDYKGAAEPYTRTSMSPQLREELSDVLSDQYELLAEAIAERLEIEVEDAKALIDEGPFTPTSAQKAGLIDRIAYEDQIDDELAKGLGVEAIKLDDEYGKPKAEDYSGLAGFMKLLQELSGQRAKKPSSKDPKIAVIYAGGTIQTGKSSSSSLFGDAVMGSDTIIEQFQKANDDETVKAIVLRVDSPGGSALASDLIWRAVTKTEKPVVASMSDVAASGGYYVSMGADKIFAEPGTITGSIGVVGGKIALGGLLEKLGVSADTVTMGKKGQLLSPFKPFTDDERAAMQKMMQETYRQFVAKAAEGRKLDVEDLEPLAGGRIYSGRKAKALGLIDEVGTLEDAIAAAKELAGLDADAQPELLALPEPKSIFEDLFSPFEDMGLNTPDIEISTPLPEPVRSLLGRLERVRSLLSSEPTLLLLPFEVRIR